MPDHICWYKDTCIRDHRSRWQQSSLKCASWAPSQYGFFFQDLEKKIQWHLKKKSTLYVVPSVVVGHLGAGGLNSHYVIKRTCHMTITGASDIAWTLILG